MIMYSYRRDHEGWFWVWFWLVFLVVLAFWGGVTYVALHFLLKVW